jgi:hypothetical protein
MRCVREGDDGRAVGSESGGGVPLWLSQPGQAAGIRPAWPRSVAPGPIPIFFRKLTCSFLKIPASLEIHKNCFMHPNLVIPISLSS